MEIYTSDEILEMEDLYAVQDEYSMGKIVRYEMTKGEWQWFEFVKGRYSIADYVWDNTEEGENGEMILTINPEEVSKALDDDNRGWGKATMLSDDSALQRLFFWLYQES